MISLEVKFEWDINGVVEEIAHVDTAAIGKALHMWNLEKVKSLI